MYEGAMYDVRKSIILLLVMVFSFSLSAQDFSADRDLFAAYQKEDMSVWKEYIDRLRLTEYRPIYSTSTGTAATS